MLESIKSNSFIRRVILGSIVILLMLIAAWGVFQNYKLEKIYAEKAEVYKQVVGALASKYPNDEAIILNSIFNYDDKNKEYGEKILNKYGYTNEIIESLASDKNVNEYMIGNIIFIIIVFLVSSVDIFIMCFYVFKHLYKISQTLTNYVDGNFEYKDDFSEEGIVNIIDNQLAILGKNISNTYDKLENEKEDSKALVTDISHQLKTPLASLSMCNSILEDDELTLDEKHEFLAMSNKNISKLQNLIECLVNISRLEAAMIKLKPVKSSLKDTVIKAYNSAYIKAQNKNIDIILEILKDYQIVHDNKWTEEAIFNVIDNGIKYTEPGGKIIITMEESLNFIKINIEDNGSGIDKNEFNNIFKRFYRGKEHEKKGIEGSGVGLYLTRKIFEDQGGSILVKSKIGSGSKFTLMLPK